MQLSELRTLVGQLQATDLDNYVGDSPSTSELNAQINRALRIISRHVEPLFGKVQLDITSGDQEVPLHGSKFARPMLGVHRVHVSSGNWIDVVSYTAFDRDTDWRFAASGTPSLAAVVSGNLTFDKAWSADATLYVQGPGRFAALVNDTDEPEFDDAFHEAIAYVVALFAAEPSVTDATAMDRLRLYAPRAFKDIEELRGRYSTTNHDLANRGPVHRL